MEPKTTKQVAEELGLNETTLLVYLSRNPHLKPVTQAHKRGALLWTAEEIAAVRKARAWHKKTRPKPQEH